MREVKVLVPFVLVLAASIAAPAVRARAQEQAAPEAAAPSLYERLGGLAPISVVVSDFVDALVPDAELNRNPAIAEARHRIPDAYLKFHVTALVCKATGGPCEYVGRGMKESHAHLNITEAEWDRMVEVFREILARHAVPDAEQQELLTIVGSTRADIVAPAAE